MDRVQAGTYLHKARGFRADAEAMAALAGEFSGNGLAVLCVHAAIAYSDALAVRAGEAKSASGEHLDAVDLLESVVRIATDGDRAAVKALRYVLQRCGRGVIHHDARAPRRSCAPTTRRACWSGCSSSATGPNAGTSSWGERAGLGTLTSRPLAGRGPRSHARRCRR